MDEGTTRHAVLKSLLQAPSTAQRVAEAVDVDPSAARRHLETLLERGWAEATFRQEGMGRPKKYYAITDAGREAFPRRYGLLLEQVAAAVERRGDAGDLERLMESVADALADEMAPAIPDDAPLGERVEAAAAALRELGFPVEVDAQGDGFAIVRRDCVFLRLAKSHPDAVCGHLDTGLLSRLLGEPARLARCMPLGDAACRHEVGATGSDGA